MNKEPKIICPHCGEETDNLEDEAKLIDFLTDGCFESEETYEYKCENCNNIFLVYMKFKTVKIETAKYKEKIWNKIYEYK